MLRKIRGRISPATVIATIALFAALGGGYATAFSGGGTLQKAAADGLTDTDAYVDVRTLNGFGTLEADCDIDDTPDTLKLQVDNTTSKPITMRWSVVQAGANDQIVNGGDSVMAGAQSDDVELEGSSPTARLHLWKSEDGNKSQVDVVVSVSIQGGSCSDVRILALNTQQ